MNTKRALDWVMNVIMAAGAVGNLVGMFYVQGVAQRFALAAVGFTFAFAAIFFTRSTLQSSKASDSK